MTRLYRWIKRLLGLYRNRRKTIKGLPEYIHYFNSTPQYVIRQHRGEIK